MVVFNQVPTAGPTTATLCGRESWELMNPICYVYIYIYTGYTDITVMCRHIYLYRDKFLYMPSSYICRMELLYAVSWHILKGESNVTLPAICVFSLFLLGNFPTYQQPVWVALLPIRTVIIYPLLPEFLRFVIHFISNEWTYTYYYCSDLSNI